MRVMKKTLLVVCCLVPLLAAAGCGTLQWKHHYKSQTEMRQDYDECQRDVRSWRRDYTGGEDAFNEQILINECMQNKGWYR
jgi:hypothetical protein